MLQFREKWTCYNLPRNEHTTFSVVAEHRCQISTYTQISILVHSWFWQKEEDDYHGAHSSEVSYKSQWILVEIIPFSEVRYHSSLLCALYFKTITIHWLLWHTGNRWKILNCNCLYSSLGLWKKENKQCNIPICFTIVSGVEQN